jgi:hypothetical protein
MSTRHFLGVHWDVGVVGTKEGLDGPDPLSLRVQLDCFHKDQTRPLYMAVASRPIPSEQYLHIAHTFSLEK